MAKAKAKAKALTPAAVAAVGAERRAAVLLQAAEYDPALMCGVRFAVASRIDAAASAAGIDQQIRSFRRSTAFVDHRQRMAFARDLGALVDAIAGGRCRWPISTRLERSRACSTSSRRSRLGRVRACHHAQITGDGCWGGAALPRTKGTRGRLHRSWRRPMIA